MAKQWLNDISRTLNGKIYKKRQRGPNIVVRYKWHEEFIKLGLDKKMSFQTYLKGKTKEWYKKRQQAHNQNSKKI